jgi:hypothetical protein
VRLAAILLALLAASAGAAVTPPAGWQRDAELAESVAAQLAKLPHFGGLPAGTIATTAFRAPGGGALYVTTLAVNATAAQRDAAASAELAELGAAATRLGIAPELGVTAENKLLIGTAIWRDPDAKLTTRSRIVIAASAQQVVAITGECMLADDAAQALVAACTAALGTIEPDLPAADRVPLTRVAPSTTPPAPPSGLAPLPSFVEGPRPTLPPMSFPPPRSDADRRPVYIGLGLVALAALFWWNRRRRDHFEREDRGGDEPDPDADDLHDAARTTQKDAHDE